VNRYLAERLAELDDGELLRRLAGGGHTEESIAVMRAELHRRGVAVPEAAPPDDDGYDDAGVSDALVEFARYGFPVEAQLLRERLEAEGVPAWVVNANVAQTFGYLRDAVGGARVMIRPDDVAAAQRVLRKLDAGDYALDAESPTESDADDVAEPPTARAVSREDVQDESSQLPAPLRKALLVIGLASAIATVFIVTQTPELWWLLLWLPLYVVRRLMRRTLAN
jgi:hypothetical protein